ncbi:MAG TPA: tetratricopeptide repeat protein, partial [Candidatus Eisenbacteria bacterium]|nr:tetratricopeptide repeat protein [Candidatus Eisenbacteria bacterium]
LVALADSAIAAAEPELARRALERAAEAAPQSAAVHLGYGRYYAAILRYKDAKTELDRAAELDPASAEPHYWLGVAYLKAGEKEQAFRSLSRALRLDPSHAGARVAIRPILEARYRAAGVPTEYATLAEHSTVTRGELGVMLAVELGVDPDRSVWRADQVHRTDWPVLDEAWGSRWLRASVARGWIGPMADRDLHLDDPVTRGALALLLAEIDVISPAPARPDSVAAGIPARADGSNAALEEFPDLGPRHYLGQAASVAARLGLPLRDGGRFEPQAFAAGFEALTGIRGLARAIGATPIVSGEADEASLVK